MRPKPISIMLAAIAALTSPAAAAGQHPGPENVVTIGYSAAHFDGGVDPWHLATAELLRRTGVGTFIARASSAWRFGETGQQFEAEAYPQLGEGVYAFLGLGWSPSGIFPDWRYTGELFGVVAPGVEFSAGVRRLHFGDDAVTLYTGSAARYLGSWYLSARPFVSRPEGEFLFSATLLARRYLRTEEEWLALSVGAGEVPSEEVTPFDLERLRAVRAELSGRHALTSSLGTRWSAGTEWEELPGERVRRRVTVGVGLEASF